MKRSAAAAVILLCIFCARGALAAPESLEAIENDLSAILADMDAVRAEMDRVAELSAMPKATGLRIEIHGAAGAVPPAAIRLLIAGKTEDEREFAKAEKDAFAGGASPLVVQLPLLPGLHKARIELSHPYWKTPVSADFAIDVKTGATALSRFRLSGPGGKGSPALAPMGGK